MKDCSKYEIDKNLRWLQGVFWSLSRLLKREITFEEYLFVSLNFVFKRESVDIVNHNNSKPLANGARVIDKMFTNYYKFINLLIKII